jgi:NodT family efflux transporter outer membrane factor (OMF) lipoprotein
MRPPLLHRRTALAGLLALALTGCASVAPPSAIGPATERHDTALPATTALGLTTGTPSRHWWHALQDEQLNTLVQTAMQHNQDRQAAVAAVRQARALAGLAERNALPQGSLSAQAQAQRPSLAEVDPYNQGLDRPPQQRLGTIAQMVSWEIDLFGRVGTASAVAQRQADAAAATAHSAEALLQAEVVRHYVLLRLYQHDLARLHEESDVLQRRHALLQARERAGLADKREALAAQAQREQALATIAQTQAALHGTRAALAVLAGRAPTTAEADSTWQALLAPQATASVALPAVPDTSGVVQPTDLLTRRPDVARADAQLRAALGETVLADRAHLPRLSLNLSAGLNAPFGALGQASAVRYAVGPALQWDWLDAGRNRARAAAAKAGDEVAWHQFENTVLQALADSESALRQWGAARTAWQHATQAESAAQRAAQHAQKRFDTGLEPPTEALQHQAQWMQARRSAMAQQADALQAYARVQLALAAWQPDDNASADRPAAAATSSTAKP